MTIGARRVAQKVLQAAIYGYARYSPLGDLSAFQEDSLEYLLRTARTGDIVPVRIVERQLFVNRPDAIQRILVDNGSNYRKGALYGRIKPLMGEGLLTSEGAFWRRQRRLSQPAFSRDRLSAFLGTMVEATSAMLSDWNRRVASGETVDVHAEANRVALHVLGETLFGSDLEEFIPVLRESVPRTLALSSERMYGLLAVPFSVPTPANIRYRMAVAELDNVVHTLIARRRRSGPSGRDLLSLWMNAVDPETGEHMDDRQLRDEAMTMLVAGHETVALAVTFTWYLLATHPHAAETVAAEAAAVFGAGRAATLEDLGRLRFTTRVIHEAMRLFPPVWIIGRRARAEDRLGAHHVSAGMSLFMSPYSMHRHPQFWDNPSAFDPDRFLPERSRPRFAYFPFGGGARQCIGNTFALAETQILVAMSMLQYRLQLEPGYRLELEATLTLRPRRGMPMLIQRRESSLHGVSQSAPEP